jgi:DNA mismatch repair protein MutH
MLYNKFDAADIERHAKILENKTLYEIAPIETVNNRLNKGSIGSFIEEYHFGYKPNSNSEPDFKEAGVELKVTPYKKNRNNTFSAKERLVLNIINYMTEHPNTFETSSFWKKNKLILLVFYLYNPDTEKKDYKITHSQLFEFPEKDLDIIRQDWDLIINKIRDGQAHELSESDTLYLSACTKGANKNSLREQPFSKIKAMQRAYSLKSSYMTYLLNTYILKRITTYKSIVNKLENQTLDEYILHRIKPYFGKSLEHLCHEFGINSKSKSKTYSVIAKMINSEIDDLNKTEEFVKSDTQIKAIRINRRGGITESMSFPTFKYTEIIKETWEDSELREMFIDKRFLFVIYYEQANGDYVLNNAFFWSLPIKDLENEVRKVWEETVRRILAKEARKLPGKSENKVSHIRPHAKNSRDTYPTHYGENIVKQCFWLNNTYILEQVKKHTNVY